MPTIAVRGTCAYLIQQPEIDKMSNGTAVISVNGIEVGAMPLEQYETIVRDVKKDWRTRTASVFRYFGFAFRLLSRMWHYFVQSFVVLFALIMLYSYFNPHELTGFIEGLRNQPAENIVNLIRLFTLAAMTITFLSGLLSIFIKGMPVYVSAAEDAINNKIREVMEVPANGQVIVRIKKDGAYGVQ
ncbi:TPA: hypothetical protein ACP6KL_004730 [Escherichia coli]